MFYPQLLRSLAQVSLNYLLFILDLFLLVLASSPALLVGTSPKKVSFYAFLFHNHFYFTT